MCRVAGTGPAPAGNLVSSCGTSSSVDRAAQIRDPIDGRVTAVDDAVPDPVERVGQLTDRGPERSTTIATAISETSSAYSTAAAPRSSMSIRACSHCIRVHHFLWSPFSLILLFRTRAMVRDPIAPAITTIGDCAGTRAGVDRRSGRTTQGVVLRIRPPKIINREEEVAEHRSRQSLDHEDHSDPEVHAAPAPASAAHASAGSVRACRNRNQQRCRGEWSSHSCCRSSSPDVRGHRVLGGVPRLVRSQPTPPGPAPESARRKATQTDYADRPSSKPPTPRSRRCRAACPRSSGSTRPTPTATRRAAASPPAASNCIRYRYSSRLQVVRCLGRRRLAGVDPSGLHPAVRRDRRLREARRTRS